MANHASADKRNRQNESRRLHNRYYAKTTRNAIRALRNTTDKEAAAALLPKVSAMIDKLAKINVIHKNKAANLKSGIAVYVNKLQKKIYVSAHRYRKNFPNFVGKFFFISVL